MIVPKPLSKLERRGGQGRLAAVLALFGLGLSAVFAYLSQDGIVHFDDVTHYLYARYAWTWPQFLLDTWGRPGFTALYFIPAGIGWTACRLLSAILAAWSAWLAYRIAQRMKLKHAWAVIILAYCQPLFFQLSLTTLTETALAFYLTSAVYLAQRGRWSWSAATLSLGFVTRHEAIVFLPVFVVFAWRARAGLWRLWPIVWAPLVVNASAPALNMGSPILLLTQPHPSQRYGAGGWLTFLARSLEAWGPAISALAISGWWATFKTRRGALTAVCIAVYFGAQTFVRALGLYDSGGYARFLVSISPLVAISALIGWQRLWTRDERIRTSATMWTAGAMIVLWTAMESQIALALQHTDLESEIPDIASAKLAMRIATAVLVILALVSRFFNRDAVARLTRPLMPAALTMLAVAAVFKLCGPLRPPPEAAAVNEALAWLNTHGYEDREIVSAMVWFDYATGRPRSPWRSGSLRERLEQAPIGAIFAWESQFAEKDYGLTPAELTAGGSFKELYRSRPVPGRVTESRILLYEKNDTWAPHAAETTRAQHPSETARACRPSLRSITIQYKYGGRCVFGPQGIRPGRSCEAEIKTRVVTIDACRA